MKSLEELARELAADPSPERRAAWLRERLRRGELAVERVRLAAIYGQPAARLLHPEIGVLPDRELRPGLLLLEPHERRLFACDGVERVLPSFERARPQDGRPRAAIEASRAFAGGALDREGLDAVRRACAAISAERDLGPNSRSLRLIAMAAAKAAAPPVAFDGPTTHDERVAELIQQAYCDTPNRKLWSRLWRAIRDGLTQRLAGYLIEDPRPVREGRFPL